MFTIMITYFWRIEVIVPITPVEYKQQMIPVDINKYFLFDILLRQQNKTIPEISKLLGVTFKMYNQWLIKHLATLDTIIEKK